MTRSGPGAAVARSVRSAVLFEALERYAAFRSIIGRRGFVVGLVSVRGLVVVGAALVGAVLGWVAARMLETASAGAAALLVVDAYVLVAYWVRQTTGQQLQHVIDPPNVALFRALDLPPLAVYTAYSAIPTALFHCALGAGNAVALALIGTAHSAPPGIWWILLVPLVGLLVTLTATATLATRHRPATSAGARRTALLLGAAALAGLGLGRLVAAVSTRDLAALDAPWLVNPPGLLVVTGLGVVLLLGVLLGWRLRLLSRHSFLVRVHTSGRDAARPARGGGVAVSAYHRTAREVGAHRSSAMLGGGARTIAGLMLFVLGLVAGGVRLDQGLVRQWLLPATTGYLYVTLLIMVGLAFSIVGPSTMMARYRFEWENSARSGARIAWDAMVFHIVLVTPLAVTVALVQTATSETVSAKPLAMAWALVGAATIGETLVPPRVRVDGTSTPGPLAPFVILLLSVPALATGIGPWWGLVQCLYGATLLGVGIQCLSRRIQRLPSSFTASPPATAVTGAPSSTA